jgi:Asp-tRNA(Asn)/Glu-tRNA(Gln) amidotransferase C subunit
MTTTPPNDFDWLAYVDAAARLQGLQLDPARREEVARQLQRIAAMAAPLMAFELTMCDEVAPIFIP